MEWRGCTGSNREPSVLETDALPVELHPRRNATAPREAAPQVTGLPNTACAGTSCTIRTCDLRFRKPMLLSAELTRQMVSGCGAIRTLEPALAGHRLAGGSLGPLGHASGHWCRRRESNPRRSDFHPDVLPTVLPRQSECWRPVGESNPWLPARQAGTLASELTEHGFSGDGFRRRPIVAADFRPRGARSPRASVLAMVSWHLVRESNPCFRVESPVSLPLDERDAESMSAVPTREPPGAPSGSLHVARSVATHMHAGEPALSHGHTRHGADDESRTRGLDHGKVALYPLSYIRKECESEGRPVPASSRGELLKSAPQPTLWGMRSQACSAPGHAAARLPGAGRG